MKHPFSRWALLSLLAIAATGCQPAPQQARADGQTTPNTNDFATTAQVAAMQERIVELDQRLQRIEGMLRQLAGEPDGPDPAVVYSVPIDGLPYVGPQHAKVTVVKAYEFACGYCAKAAPMMRQLIADYRGQVKVVYAPFIIHADDAVLPALAVCAANAQDKFAAMETLMWQKAWGERDLSEEKISGLASEVGLDMVQYRKDLTSEGCMDSLRKSIGDLSRVGTRGTPTFYINGRAIVGAQPIDRFKALIDEELAKANQAVAGGMAVKDYYRKVVVEGGQKSL